MEAVNTGEELTAVSEINGQTARPSIAVETKLLRRAQQDRLHGERRVCSTHAIGPAHGTELPEIERRPVGVEAHAVLGGLAGSKGELAGIHVGYDAGGRVDGGDIRCSRPDVGDAPGNDVPWNQLGYTDGRQIQVLRREWVARSRELVAFRGREYRVIIAA